MTRFFAEDMAMISNDRKVERNNNTKELASLYLNLAYFYIKESAEKGWVKCGVYLPARVQEIAVNSLTLYGYEVLKWEHRPNWFIVSWEKQNGGRQFVSLFLIRC